MKDKFVTLSSLKRFKEKQDALVDSFIQALENTISSGDADLNSFLQQLREQLNELKGDVEGIEEENDDKYVPKDTDNNWWKDKFHLNDFVKFSNIDQSTLVQSIKDKTDLFTHTKIDGKDWITINDGASLKGPISGYISTVDFNNHVSDLQTTLSHKLTDNDIKVVDGIIKIKDTNLITPLTKDNLVSSIETDKIQINQALGVTSLSSTLNGIKGKTDVMTINDGKITFNGNLDGYSKESEVLTKFNDINDKLDLKAAKAELLKDGILKTDLIPTLKVEKLEDFDSALAGKHFINETFASENLQSKITSDSKLDYSLLKSTPTLGSLASKDTVTKELLNSNLKTEIEGKLTSDDITLDNDAIKIKGTTLITPLTSSSLATAVKTNKESINSNLGIKGLAFKDSLVESDVPSTIRTRLSDAESNIEGKLSKSDISITSNSETGEKTLTLGSDKTITLGSQAFKNKVSYNSLEDKPTLFSGNYNDLSGKPTKLSEFTNDSGFTKFDGQYSSLSGKPSKLSDFTNDEGFTKFDGKYSSLSGKPTLLTTSDVDTEILNKVKIESGTIKVGNNSITPLTEHQSLSAYLKSSDAAVTYQGKIDSDHKLDYSLLKSTPTSLPASDVPAWAKASSKPTYTASEVGAREASWVPSVKDLPSNIPTSKISSLDTTLGTLSTQVGEMPTLSQDGKTINFKNGASFTHQSLDNYQTKITTDSKLPFNCVADLGSLAKKSSLTESDIPSLGISKITNLKTTLDNKLVKDDISYDSTTGILKVKGTAKVTVPKVGIQSINTTTGIKKRATLKTIENDVEEDYILADDNDLGETDAVLGADPTFDYVYAGFGLKYNNENLKGYIASIDTYFENINLKTPKTKLFLKDALKGSNYDGTQTYFFDATKRQNTMNIGHFILATKKPALKNTSKLFYSASEFNVSSNHIINNSDQTVTYNQGMDYIESNPGKPLYIYLEVTKTYTVSSGTGSYEDIEEISDYEYYPVYKYCIVNSGSEVKSRLAVLEYLLMQYQIISPEVFYSVMSNAGIRLDQVPALACTNFSWGDNYKFEILQNASGTTTLGQSANNIENRAVHARDKQIVYDNDIYQG